MMGLPHACERTCQVWLVKSDFSHIQTMKRENRMFKTLIMNALVAVAMVAMITPAQANLVSTGDTLALEAGSLETRVEAYLLRDGVAAELALLGVSHEMAIARVANMSADELEQIAGRIDQMPAGEGAIVILGVVFLVLIILELVGVTNVFRR